jgi:hypothetical protein
MHTLVVSKVYAYAPPELSEPAITRIRFAAMVNHEINLLV